MTPSCAAVAYRFLHTSDIHLLDLQGVRPWHYLNKRATGRLNLALHRGRHHDASLFTRMMKQATDLDVDRVVVTGDLTNLSLPSEFASCRDTLRDLAMPVTVIPGNHDAYVASIVRKGVFEEFMGGFMEGERVEGRSYPFVQRLPGLALIGVSSAVATLPFVATGKIGPAQLGRLDRMLQETASEGRVRVVMVHHPPVPGVSKARHHLEDMVAFAEVIARRGAELVLHGHEHRRIDSRLRGPGTEEVAVHGTTSGTSLSATPGKRAGFSVYEIDAGRLRRGWYEWNGHAFEQQEA